MSRISIDGFFCLLAVLVSLYLGDQSFAKVYIDIDSPSFQKFPIAITEFKKDGTEPCPEDLSGWFADSLGNYLTMTGFFNSISRKAFLNDQNRTASDERIDFDAWTVIGAEYLVKGIYSFTGGMLMAEFRLYDVVKGELITGKQYTGKIEQKPEMARQFAREVLIALTGDGRIFDTKIAFVMKKKGMSDIYTIDFDGSKLTKITDEEAITLAPHWSTDGRYMSYTSYRDGNPDIFLKSFNESTATKKIAGYAGINISGSWSQDSNRVLIASSKDGNEEIYVMDIKTGHLERLTHRPDIDVSPVWSPDNQKIAFVSNRSGSPQIYIMDKDGSNVKRLTYDGSYNTSPAWSPRGKKIAYESLAGGRFQVFTIDEDGANNVQMTFDHVDHESPTWSPDGRYLAFYTRGNSAGVYIMNANGLNTRLLYKASSGFLGTSWSPQLK